VVVPENIESQVTSEFKNGEIEIFATTRQKWTKIGISRQISEKFLH